MAYVLIVDDEPDLITLLRDQIGMLGHEVGVARDGVEGVQIALERRPDVVVTDVIMPNMDGAEMLMELRRRPETRDVPVIALSALTDARTQARMAGLGVVGFLAKPYSLRDLAQEIEKAAATARPPSCGCQAADASRRSALRLVTSSRASDPWNTTISFFACGRCGRRWRNERAWRYPVDDDDLWEEVTGKPEYDLHFASEHE